MEFHELRQIVESTLEHSLNEEQLNVVKHKNGPLWVVAGPGSGKTEVLIIRTLKLIFVDNVNPKSIIITTFTKKAAKNLFNKILKYSNHIFKIYPALEQKVDIHNLRLGTIHALCNDIMLEYKTPSYENYRLLDDIEQYLFIYEHSDLVLDTSKKYIPLWNKFDFLLSGYDEVTRSTGWVNRDETPNKWKKTDASISIFDRIVDDMVDLKKLEDSGHQMNLVLTAYRDYFNKLEKNGRCDFAHLQKKFLYFLNSELGTLFLEGSDSKNNPGIKFVMVDEYQDTNLVQEKIYFTLGKKTHNLCVVGDDDQALYRFRGGTVDCMVTFDKACDTYFGLDASAIKPIFLNENYRSHPSIVNYYNSYIKSFEVMNKNGARVNKKPLLEPRSGISGGYPSFAYLTGDTTRLTATNFANFVKYLLDNSVLNSPSQCALLMQSVKETKRYASPFADALRQVGIEPYNPRSRKYLNQEEIRLALGAFISVIDPKLGALNLETMGEISNLVQQWVDFYRSRECEFPELADYITKSVASIKNKGVDTLPQVNILEIFYRILAHEPFLAWSNDPERTSRLGKLSNIFEAYSSTPINNSSSNTRGNLWINPKLPGEISFTWRQSFYYSFVGLLISKGMNDPEDEEIICPPNRLPIMTVHQAKGLEFPFVFIYGLRVDPEHDSSASLEDSFVAFREKTPFVNFSIEERAQQDVIRFYYVAYSRPQYALIHLAPRTELAKNGYGMLENNRRKFKQVVERLERE